MISAPTRVPRYTDGALSIIKSAIISNNSGEKAFGSAAIFNDAGGNLTLTNCNVSSDTDWFGGAGGISNVGTLLVNGSTISGEIMFDSEGAGTGLLTATQTSSPGPTAEAQTAHPAYPLTIETEAPNDVIFSI